MSRSESDKLLPRRRKAADLEHGGRIELLPRIEGFGVPIHSIYDGPQCNTTEIPLSLITQGHVKFRNVFFSLYMFAVPISQTKPGYGQASSLLLQVILLANRLEIDNCWQIDHSRSMYRDRICCTWPAEFKAEPN